MCFVGSKVVQSWPSFSMNHRYLCWTCSNGGWRQVPVQYHCAPPMQGSFTCVGSPTTELLHLQARPMRFFISTFCKAQAHRKIKPFTSNMSLISVVDMSDIVQISTCLTRTFSDQ